MIKRSWVFFTLFFVMISFFVGCVSVPPKPEVVEATEPLEYSFTFAPTAPPANKLAITVGIVSLDWGKEPLTYDAVFAVKSNDRLMKPDMTAQRGPLPENTVMLFKEFDKAIDTEFEAMMIRRGFDTMRFKKIDDMTYPQKQACNLILYPEIHVSLKSMPELVEIQEVKGNAIMNVEMVLNVFEPLSRKKLWMKRISINSNQFPFRYLFRYQRIYEQKTGQLLVGYERQGIKWDNRSQRVGVALTKFYTEIMETSWKYFSPEEFAILRKHSDEIRERKRF